MPDAARATDQISHTSAMAGLLVGLAVGAVAAVAIAATIATGGVAGVLIGAGIGLAGTAGGGLAGEYIGAAIPSAPTGFIATGSPNVLVGSLPAARAVLDASVCSGLPLIPHGPSPIAQGSKTVFINGMMAARVGDMLACSAKISSGCSTVIIGDVASNTPGVVIEPEVPSGVNSFLFGAMVGGIVIGTGGAALAFGVPAALSGLAGSLLGGAGLGWVGGKVGESIGSIFGAPELGKRIGEVAGGVIGSVIGGGVAGRWAGKRWPRMGPAPLEPPPPEVPPEPPPKTDPASAGKAPDRGDLTKAGRALQKHGSRSGSAFPQARGNPSQINQQGQTILEDIINNPGTTQKPNRFGGVDYIAPDGRGARFAHDGSMMGFLEP